MNVLQLEAMERAAREESEKRRQLEEQEKQLGITETAKTKAGRTAEKVERRNDQARKCQKSK